MDTLSQPKPGTKCSFCGAAPAEKSYLAAPALITLGRIAALICDSEWEACAPCAALIDQDRWEDLAQCVLEVWSRESRTQGVVLDFEERDRLKRALLQVHAAIRAAMGRTA